MFLMEWRLSPSYLSLSALISPYLPLSDLIPPYLSYQVDNIILAFDGVEAVSILSRLICPYLSYGVDNIILAFDGVSLSPSYLLITDLVVEAVRHSLHSLKPLILLHFLGVVERGGYSSKSSMGKYRE